MLPPCAWTRRDQAEKVRRWVSRSSEGQASRHWPSRRILLMSSGTQYMGSWVSICTQYPAWCSYSPRSRSRSSMGRPPCRGNGRVVPDIFIIADLARTSITEAQPRLACGMGGKLPAPGLAEYHLLSLLGGPLLAGLLLGQGLAVLALVLDLAAHLQVLVGRALGRLRVRHVELDLEDVAVLRIAPVRVDASEALLGRVLHVVLRLLGHLIARVPEVLHGPRHVLQRRHDRVTRHVLQAAPVPLEP